MCDIIRFTFLKGNNITTVARIYLKRRVWKLEDMTGAYCISASKIWEQGELGSDRENLYLMTDFKTLRRQSKKDLKCIGKKRGRKKESKPVSECSDLNKRVRNGTD